MIPFRSARLTYFFFATQTTQVQTNATTQSTLGPSSYRTISMEARDPMAAILAIIGLWMIRNWERLSNYTLFAQARGI